MVDNEILSLEEISKFLKDKKLYIVANETGLSYPTIKRIADNKEANHTINTLKLLSKYINSNK